MEFPSFFFWLVFERFQLNLQVHDLLKAYTEIEVPPERLLFKIPATWQVSAIRQL